MASPRIRLNGSSRPSTNCTRTIGRRRRCGQAGRRGIDIAPTYDSGDRWIATLQHIERECGCWVVGSGAAFRSCDLPDSLPGKAVLYPNPDDWINPGDSAVVATGGKIAVGPMRHEFGILLADIDLDQVGFARRSLDVVGHYARPDIFQLHINTSPLDPVVFEQSPAPWKR